MAERQVILKQQPVESLFYQMRSAEDITYDDPPALDVDTETWRGHLENGILTCHMKVHYSSVGDARKEVESYLRDWEISAAIEYGRRSMTFSYWNASVIKLAPEGEGGDLVYLEGRAACTARATAKLTITRRNYLPPPELFRVSPNVETLWGRYEGYLDGKEPLLGMAYFCLSTIEVNYGQGSRKTAAHTLNVGPEVLDTLGRLISTKGDSTAARKAPDRGKWQPLSGTERTWIEAVVKRLIYRVGEYAGCDDSSTLAIVGMQDFLPLR
jgi:hypothetical protein